MAMAPEVLQQKAEMGRVSSRISSEFEGPEGEVWIPGDARYDVGSIHGRIATKNTGPSEGPETRVTESSK